METNTIMELFNNVGVATAMLVYFIYDKVKVTAKMTEAINNNNLILNKLLIKLDADELADTTSE